MKHDQGAAARKAYPSDPRDAEWAILEPLAPAVKPGGRPARHSRREVVNAIRHDPPHTAADDSRRRQSQPGWMTFTAII